MGFNVDLIGKDQPFQIHQKAPPVEFKPGKETLMWGGTDPFPRVCLLFWRGGILRDDAQGNVWPYIEETRAGAGTPGVVCDESKLILPGAPGYDEATSGLEAMDFSGFLERAQADRWIRVDHLIGNLPVDRSEQANKALGAYNTLPKSAYVHHGWKLIGIDVTKDTDLPKGWDADPCKILQYALKVKRFDVLRELSRQATFHNNTLRPTDIIQQWALSANDDVRKGRQEIYQRVVDQYALWNQILREFRANHMTANKAA